MKRLKESVWHIYGFAIICSLLITAAVGINLGLASLLTVFILAGIEISFSFENAIINAKILQRMSFHWQRLFMTVGILIAVFVVRFFIPIIIVAITTDISLGNVMNLALHNPAEYSASLTSAQPVIAAFGGMFLLMIFLDFIFETRPVMWLVPIERRLAVFGKLESLSVIVALAILLFFSQIVASEHSTVMMAGIIGILVYLVINTLESAERLIDDTNHSVPLRLLKGGFVGFLYLELIDASFSLDGVIGAFAITADIILITAGLAIGALFVRAMTIHLLRRGTLNKYIYLDHGAHYAIGLLALLLLVSIGFDLPNWLTGLSGITIISIALLDSYFEAKRKQPNISLL